MPTLDSETKQSPIAGSADPAKAPAKTGENWDSLRGLAIGVQKQHRAVIVRTVFLALLILTTLIFVGWVLHEHIPALVSFGKEVGETVAKFSANVPKPSEPARSTSVQDQRTRKKSLPNHLRVRQAVVRSDPAYDLLNRPFYATAIIGGRRVFLASNDGTIVLDIASGRWTIEKTLP